MVLGEMALGEKALGETAWGESAVRHNCRPPVNRDFEYIVNKIVQRGNTCSVVLNKSLKIFQLFSIILMSGTY